MRHTQEQTESISSPVNPVSPYLLSKRYTVMLRVINNADLCFAEWNRGGVGGVSNVQHGGTRWRQGFIDGVEVGPGQPVG